MKKGLGYNLDYSRAGSDYNPGIGFEQREDFTRVGNRLWYGWMPGEESALFQHEVFLEGFVLTRNEDGNVESAEVGPGYFLFTKSYAAGNISPKLYYENVSESFSLSDDADVPVGEYTFFGLTTLFTTPSTRLVYTEGTFDVGTFYDGWRLSASVSPYWSVSSTLELSGKYEFNRIRFPDRNQEFIAQIVGLRALVMLSVKFSASTFIQYTSAGDRVIVNARFRYNPREGNDLYVVYNEGLNTDRFREVPILPRTSDRTLMLKYTYTLSF